MRRPVPTRSPSPPPPHRPTLPMASPHAWTLLPTTPCPLYAQSNHFALQLLQFGVSIQAVRLCHKVADDMGVLQDRSGLCAVSTTPRIASATQRAVHLQHGHRRREQDPARSVHMVELGGDRLVRRSHHARPHTAPAARNTALYVCEAKGSQVCVWGWGGGEGENTLWGTACKWSGACEPTSGQGPLRRPSPPLPSPPLPPRPPRPWSFAHPILSVETSFLGYLEGLGWRAGSCSTPAGPPGTAPLSHRERRRPHAAQRPPREAVE